MLHEGGFIKLGQRVRAILHDVIERTFDESVRLVDVSVDRNTGDVVATVSVKNFIELESLNQLEQYVVGIVRSETKNGMMLATSGRTTIYTHPEFVRVVFYFKCVVDASNFQ